MTRIRGENAVTQAFAVRRVDCDSIDCPVDHRIWSLEQYGQKWQVEEVSHLGAIVRWLGLADRIVNMSDTFGRSSSLS